jgi:hypothetical protein
VVFGHVVPCSLVDASILEECAASVLMLPCTLKMEAAASCELLVSIHLLTWCHITEHHDLTTHCHVNLNSNIHFSNLKLLAAFYCHAEVVSCENGRDLIGCGV